MTECETCKIEFKPKNKGGKYCSVECYGKAYTLKHRLAVTCPQCSTEFMTLKSKPNSFCSNDCYHASRVGTTYVAKPRPVNKLTGNCEQCDQEFTGWSKEQRFCSRPCKHLASRKMKTCLCGKEFWHGPHMLNASKFCSDKCRNELGQTKKSHDVTATCVGCAEEFTQKSWYPSKMLYCSNKCAKKEQKFGWAKRALEMEDGSVLIFRSLWELRFVACCERFGIPWRNYDGPDIQTSVGVYRPDFIVTQDGRELIVEVKGYMTQESATKIDDAVLQLDNFCLVDLPTLLQIEASGF